MHFIIIINLQEVLLEKKNEEKLGMVIKGGLEGQRGNPDDKDDEGVFISVIHPGGVASTRPEDLIVGQRIIEVNGQSLLGATHAEAVKAMRESGNSIHLIVCDGYNKPLNNAAALQNGGSGDQADQVDHTTEEVPPRPDSAQEIFDAVKAADEVFRPKSPGACSTKSTDSLREQRLTTIKMASQATGGPTQTSTVRNLNWGDGKLEKSLKMSRLSWNLSSARC